ncbi:hypothetical protein QQF64_025077 [Cirrhinus molitorella]
MSAAIYSNTIPRPTSRSAHKDQNRNCFADKREAISVVVFLSVLLFLSLLANSLLPYLYYSNGLDGLISCEPVRNCSDRDVGNDAHIEQFLHKVMENRSQAHHCPKKNFSEKWVQNNGRFYAFSTDTKDWNSSRQRCQDLGGDLVIINSSNEQRYLADQIHSIGTQTLYWIGLTDSRTEGVWLWVDDTKNHLSFWARPPDDYKSADNPMGEDCVVLNGRMSEAKWGDVFCLREERSICEIPCS